MERQDEILENDGKGVNVTFNSPAGSSLSLTPEVEIPNPELNIAQNSTSNPNNINNKDSDHNYVDDKAPQKQLSDGIYHVREGSVYFCGPLGITGSQESISHQVGESSANSGIENPELSIIRNDKANNSNQIMLTKNRPPFTSASNEIFLRTINLIFAL